MDWYILLGGLLLVTAAATAIGASRAVAKELEQAKDTNPRKGLSGDDIERMWAMALVQLVVGVYLLLRGWFFA